MTEADKDTDLFAVIAEFKGEAPILMETSGEVSSWEAARKRADDLSQRPNVIRTCVVQLQPTDHGNSLVLLDMKRMQK